MTVFIACAAVLLCGCHVVGPDYTGVLSPQLQPQFLHQTTSDSTGPAAPPPQWISYQDDVLSTLIQRGLAESPDVAELYWRVVQSRALAEIAAGQKLPFLDGLGTYENRKRSASSQPFVGSNGDPFDFFSIGLGSRWELDLFGRIQRETEAAVADLQSTTEDLHDTRRLLAGEIARSYIQLRLFQELTASVEKNLRLQRTSLKQVNLQIQAGKVGKLDLAQIRSRIGLTESDLPVFNELLKLSFNRLAVLLGESPSQTLVNLVSVRPQLDVPLVGSGVPADLLRARPDVRSAERLVAAASARIGVAQAELYPRFALNGTISLDSRNLGDILSFNSLAYTVGPSFAWNLLSLGRIEKSIQARKAEYQQAIQAYRRTVLAAVADVENSLVSHDQNLKRIAILKRTAKDAGQSVKLSTEQYLAGVTGLERLISNQRRLLQASISLAQSRAALATASVNLRQATGLRWAATGPNRPPTFCPPSPPADALSIFAADDPPQRLPPVASRNANEPVIGTDSFAKLLEDEIPWDWSRFRQSIAEHSASGSVLSQPDKAHPNLTSQSGQPDVPVSPQPPTPEPPTPEPPTPEPRDEVSDYLPVNQFNPFVGR